MLNLPEEEKKILDFWEKEHTFQQSLAARKKGKPFVFYEGPPTANGKPGLHHVLARAYKDIVLRYKTMQGFYVPRKAGWDTHGLPVELEVEKQLGLNSKKDIETYGVEAFVNTAKESVWRYKQEWEELTRRMGFWLDLENPYITYQTPYIESLWFIIKALWEKKLFEQDFKVVPWCYRCGTPLSSHELAQGYKKVTDQAFYVKFRVKPGQKINHFTTDDRTYILAWTTTPWTLPGNVALAVGENISYTRVHRASTSEMFFIATERKSIVLDHPDYISTESYGGKDLVGLSYEPLFDIPALQSETSHKAYAADFVITDEGTGVVHTSVMYGEDDHRLGKQVGLPMFHTVTPEGTFINSLPAGLGGLVVKSEEAQNAIENYLQQKGLLFAKEDYTHEYPFCWRCKTPLIYYATKSWFIKVTKKKQELLANNETINWIPGHLKHGRFGNFLEEVKDWAFSRERYWGTPLPIWQCQECRSYSVIGSLSELAKQAKPRNTFILLRHGEAQNNLTDVLSSLPEQTAYGLTDSGKRQIEKLARLLKDERVDIIFTSPLERTKETARILTDVLNVRVVEDERLRELDMGPFNGKTFPAYQEFWGSKQGRFSKQGLPGMENFHDLKIRLLECIQELNRAHEGKTIVLITHKGPLWVLEGTLRGLSEEQIASSFPEDFESGEARRAYIKLPFNREGEVDLHRPFIDEIVLRCPQCKNGRAKRVPEVADVWFDSGAMPYAQAHWPFAFATTDNQLLTTNPPKAEELEVGSGKLDFPADYICEAIDQTRGWFYVLLALATVLGFEAPYKNVISLGHLLDEKGRKMSKSLGNIIDPFEAANQYGMDTIRWYFYVVNPPGFYKRFDPKEILSHQRRFLLTLFNAATFLTLYANQDKTSVKKYIKQFTSKPPKRELDKWLFSRLHQTVRETTNLLERYEITQATRLIEKFINDLSNWYIRSARNRFRTDTNSCEAVASLYIALETVAKLIAPFVPFSAEILAQEFLNPLGFSNITSIHLEDWPKANEKFVNKELEEQMQQARDDVMLVLAVRAKEGIKVRQPLALLKTKRNHPKEIQELIAQEVNVQQVVTDSVLLEDILLDTHIDRALLLKGFVREFRRQVQDLRKQTGLKPGQAVRLLVSASDEIKTLLTQEQQSLEAQLSVAMKFAQASGAPSSAKTLNFEDKDITIWLEDAS